MPVTEAGWVPYFNDLKLVLDEIFLESAGGILLLTDEEINESIEDNDGNISFDIIDEDKQRIKEVYDDVVNMTREKTVDDINDEIGIDVDVVDDVIVETAKELGAIFLITSVADGLNRIVKSKIARQPIILGEQQEALDNAISVSTNNIDTVARQQLSTTYFDIAREQQTKNGITEFDWMHGGSSDPRQQHLDINGNRYNWRTGAPVEGTFPGIAFNCSCYAVPVIQETINKINRDEKMSYKQNIFNVVKNNDLNEIWIQGEIGWYDSFEEKGVISSLFRQTLDNALALDNKVTIIVDSEGGMVYEGLAIYHYIKDKVKQGSKIDVHIKGLCASIATLIPLAVPSENRKISSGSIGMIHNCSGCACGKKEEIEDYIEEMAIIDETIARIYENETNLSFEQAMEMMERDTFFSAEKFSELGFANMEETLKPIEAKKARIHKMLSKIRTCDINNTKVTNKKGKGNMELEELKNLINELKDKLLIANDKATTDQGKIEVLENKISEYENKIQELENSIKDIKDTSMENARRELSDFSDFKARAEQANFDVNNSTSMHEAQKDVLKQAKVSNVDNFNDDQLKAMVDYVLSSTSEKLKIEEEEENDNDGDLDDVLSPSPKNKSKGFKRPKQKIKRTI